MNNFTFCNLNRQKAPDLVMPLTVDTAKARYQMALANLKRNETLLGYTKIVAPFSGTITRRWADVGALIPAATASSSPQSAAVVTLTDSSRVRIEVAVPEAEAPLVKTGMEAEIAVLELPGKAFRGTVSRFADVLDDATRTMATEIELPNVAHELRAGMFCTVKLAIARKPDALLIPTAALLVEKAATSVFVLTGDKAGKARVKVGFEDGESVEILEGVAAYDTVILPGKLALADGQPVKVMEGK